MMVKIAFAATIAIVVFSWYIYQKISCFDAAGLDVLQHTYQWYRWIKLKHAVNQRSHVWITRSQGIANDLNLFLLHHASL
jgi:hypothetical protein